MSDILIKNMKMPKNCYECPIKHHSYSLKDDCTCPACFAMDEWIPDEDEKPDWCPLIELPKHGRLIDADALDIRRREQQAWQDYEYNPDNEYLEGVKDGLHEAAKCLSTAPIIIPAEEGE